MLASLLILPAASAAPWLQLGFDAARSGATTDGGPERFDVVLRENLTGERPDGAPPVILDGRVFALVTDRTAATSRLVAVDLRTTAVATLAEMTGPDADATALASDGARLLVARGRDVAAYGLDGTLLWSTPYPDAAVDERRVTRCIEPAVADGVAYFACEHRAFVVGGEPPAVLGPGRLAVPHRAFVVALAVEDGREIWAWAPVEEPPAAGDPMALPPARRGGTAGAQATSLAVAEGTVLVAAREGRYRLHDAVWALDARDGTVRWTFDVSFNDVLAFRDAEEFLPPRTAYLDGGPAVTVADGLAYVKFDVKLRALDLATGEERWALALQDGGVRWGGNALAAAGDALYATSFSSIYRIRPDTQQIDWQATGDVHEADYQGIRGLVLADGLLYARTYGGVIVARSVETGEVAWQASDGTSPGALPLHYGVGERVLVLLADDGALTVYGRTVASIAPSVAATTLYPAPGETVTLDLSGSGAGARGPATEYRVDWGDATETTWQPSPLLAHAYDAPGVRVATVELRNAAGQTASAAIRFDVGGAPPTFLERAFAAENQERTFFVLGLLVTGLAALAGLARVRRQRGLVVRELEAVEVAYAARRRDPAACEAALAERKARARALVLSRKLDVAQHAMLDGRIEELRRALRIELVEEELDFLPYSLVKALREMLGDGRVTAWERGHFLAALERDRVLAPDQKARVRRLIDAWAERDVAAARAPETRPGA